MSPQRKNARKTYPVTAERDGRTWLIRVPEVDRSTHARRLDQAEEMARDVISTMTGEEPDSFDVAVSPVGGRARVQQLEASIAAREAADARPEELRERLRREMARMDDGRTEIVARAG